MPTIATTIGVVRLPGSPPTQCLSTTMPAGHLSCSPASTIAWVSARISLCPSGTGSARGEERSEMNVRIFAVHDILDDGMERGLAEIVPIDAAAHVTERVERSRMPDRDAAAIGQAEPCPGGFGQCRLVRRDQVAGRLVQRGDDLSLAVAQQNARVRGKPLGSANVALLVHEDDGFVLCVQTEPPCADAVRPLVRAGGPLRRSLMPARPFGHGRGPCIASRAPPRSGAAARRMRQARHGRRTSSEARP